jgi:hypothetical protein
LSRVSPYDKDIPKSLTVNFTNNSQVIISVLYFTYYIDKFDVDVGTGTIMKI